VTDTDFLMVAFGQPVSHGCYMIISLIMGSNLTLLDLTLS